MYKQYVCFCFGKNIYVFFNCSSNVVGLYGYKRVGLYGAVPGTSI